MPELLVNPPGYIPGAKPTRDMLFRGIYRAQSADVLYTATSPVDMFDVQINTLVIQAIAHIQTAWVGTTPTNSVGDTGSATRFLATTDITQGTIGFYTKAASWGYTAIDKIRLAIGGTGLSAGKTRVWIIYAPRTDLLVP